MKRDEQIDYEKYRDILSDMYEKSLIDEEGNVLPHDELKEM